MRRPCSSCGEPYSPAADAGGMECGVCIALQIEAGLSRLAASERKPMRRAEVKRGISDETPESFDSGRGVRLGAPAQFGQASR